MHMLNFPCLKQNKKNNNKPNNKKQQISNEIIIKRSDNDKTGVKREPNRKKMTHSLIHGNEIESLKKTGPLDHL